MIFGRFGIFAAVLFAVLGGGVLGAAEMDFVSDRSLCPLSDIDRQEAGLTLRSTTLSTVEFLCTFDRLDPIDWSVSTTQVRTGYCEEPELLFPMVFVFQTFDWDAGSILMYMGDSGEASIYYSCNTPE